MRVIDAFRVRRGIGDEPLVDRRIDVATAMEGFDDPFDQALAADRFRFETGLGRPEISKHLESPYRVPGQDV